VDPLPVPMASELLNEGFPKQGTRVGFFGKNLSSLRKGEKMKGGKKNPGGPAVKLVVPEKKKCGKVGRKKICGGSFVSPPFRFFCETFVGGIEKRGKTSQTFV